MVAPYNYRFGCSEWIVGKQEVSVPSCLTVIHNAPILDRLDLADFHTDRFKGGTGVVAVQNWRQPVIDKQVIHVPDLKTIGPYSQAVRAAGLLFVSGQPGVDPATGEAVGDSFELQVRQVFRNLDMVLRAGGSRLHLVVNTTVLVTDVSNFPLVNSAFAEHFPKNPPARMTMQVPLPKGLLISIGCVAVVEN